MTESRGVFLLKSGRKAVLFVIFGRTGIIVLMFALQLCILFGAFRWFKEFLPHIFGGTFIFYLFMILYLLNSGIDNSAKLTWLLVILLFPVFGALLYLFTKSEIGHRDLRDRSADIIDKTKDIISFDYDLTDKLNDDGVASLTRYLHKYADAVLYDNTEVEYFESGEKAFEQIIIKLKEAKKFIFLEYFIIQEGFMWGNILEILINKVKEGVDVRVIYDGTCEFLTLSGDYYKRLEAFGIKCKTFAPITPFISTQYNYRDHRKIIVVDGETAFTGGINLADEYINNVSRFGHWKDTAIMLRGDAVKSFTLMFLQMWNLYEKNRDFSVLDEDKDFNSETGQGFVIPYADCPVDNEHVGEQVYIDILNRAKRYVYIMTPYLILDGELEAAIAYAAKRGVDVRLILPGIPDKFFPYALAFTHYKTLIEAGVKLGEYIPGFVHSKVFICDGNEAVVGTINLDYRSLYHHFECAAFLYKVPCIDKIYDDFCETWKRCRFIYSENLYEKNMLRLFYGCIIKPLSPLL